MGEMVCNDNGNNFTYNCSYSNTTNVETCYGSNNTLSDGMIQTTFLNTGYMYNTDSKNSSVNVSYCSNSMEIL
jgi:hypothetical protein